MAVEKPRFGTTRRCRRCQASVWMMAAEDTCARCGMILRRKTRGLCAAQIHHGPGHMSSTFCTQPTKKHLKYRGRNLHTSRYGSGERAEWFGTKKFTGYFDEPPTSPREVK